MGNEEIALAARERAGFGYSTGGTRDVEVCQQYSTRQPTARYSNVIYDTIEVQRGADLLDKIVSLTISSNCVPNVFYVSVVISCKGIPGPP
jgi:hypothetical protein